MLSFSSVTVISCHLCKFRLALRCLSSTNPHEQTSPKSFTKRVKSEICKSSTKDQRDVSNDVLQYTRQFIRKPDEISVPNPCAIEPEVRDGTNNTFQGQLKNFEKKSKWVVIGQSDSLKLRFKEYLNLGKIRLTSLVVLSAMGGFAIAPVPLSFSSFCGVSAGVLLTSMCANSINQFLEAPYDSQMMRTQNRPLVKRSLTPQNAVMFASVCGLGGLAVLYTWTNALTAGIGLANVLLYTAVYTPLKRVTIVNTWIGSVVGALPPLMGWTAATGSFCPAALIMPLVLYSWQFPHFNALSWNLRGDYSRAGYQMMSVTNPSLSQRVAFRHTLFLFPICLAAPLSGLTMWFFALDSSLLNAYFSYLGYQFYKQGDSQSARALFRFSLLYLPLVVGLMLCSKYWDCFTLVKDTKLLSVRDPKKYHLKLEK